MRWFVVLAVLALWGLPAGAAQSGGIGIYPTGNLGGATPWFRYQLARGHSLTGSVTVANRSPAAIDVLVYPVDALPAAGGGFGMMPQASRPVDAGSWISLTPRQLHLDPGSSQNLPFQFGVPANASVGPHYAGIVAQPVQSATTTSHGLSLQLVTRVGVRLYETVPGSAHPRLAIDWLRHRGQTGHVSLELSLRNAGNTLAVPSGQLTVTNLLGQPVTTLSFTASHSLPPGHRLTRQLVTALPASGLPRRYTVRLQIRDRAASPAATATQTISFWTGEFWSTLLQLLVLLFLLIGGAIAHYRLRRRLT